MLKHYWYLKPLAVAVVSSKDCSTSFDVIHPNLVVLPLRTIVGYLVGMRNGVLRVPKTTASRMPIDIPHLEDLDDEVLIHGFIGDGEVDTIVLMRISRVIVGVSNVHEEV